MPDYSAGLVFPSRDDWSVAEEVAMLEAGMDRFARENPERFRPALCCGGFPDCECPANERHEPDWAAA